MYTRRESRCQRQAGSKCLKPLGSQKIVQEKSGPARNAVWWPERLLRRRETKRKELQGKRKGFEETRKSLLAETHGELEVTLGEEKMCPCELEVTKKLLPLPLLQLTVRKDEKTFPLCFEKKAKG